MPHTIAKLQKSNNPKLKNQINNEISINTLSEMYENSFLVKSDGNIFECACTQCAVSLVAVIPMKYKKGRKKSPSPYYKGRHTSNCKNHYKQDTKETTVKTSKPIKEANSNQADYPTIWNTPHSSQTSSNNNSLITEKDEDSENLGRKSSKRHKRIGGGQSQRSSQEVREFAIKWSLMNVPQRKEAPFLAPWNKNGAGTYFSAFYPMGYEYYKKNDICEIGTKIFQGTIYSLEKTSKNTIFILNEKDKDNKQLQFWISNDNIASQNNKAELVGATIYALGFFEVYQPNKEIDVKSLEIKHKCNLYIGLSLFSSK